MYFIRNTVRISPKFSPLGLVMFLKACSATPRKREWKKFILSSSVSWLWIFKLVWNRSSNSSNFYDFPSMVGIVVVRDLGNFEIMLMLLLKLAELVFVASCWRANKIWSASIVAVVFSLRKCGWLVTRFSAFLRKYQGSSRESLLDILLSCEGDCESLQDLLSPGEDHLPPPGYLDYQTDEKKVQLWDRDRLRNDPQWVSGFLSCCSWMFPQQLRNKSQLVGSEEVRQVLTGHLRYDTLSYWIPPRVFKLLSLRFLQ